MDLGKKKNTDVTVSAIIDNGNRGQIVSMPILWTGNDLFADRQLLSIVF